MNFVILKISKFDLSSDVETTNDYDEAFDTFCQWCFELSNDTGENPPIFTSKENGIDKTADYEEYRIVLKMTNKK